MMLDGVPKKDNSWKVEQNDKEIVYASQFGKVVIIKNPWHVEFYDANGKLFDSDAEHQ